MNLIDGFEITRISSKRQDYEVKVKTPGAKNYVDILDVGVGISEVLPVIVEIFYAPPGSTIIMEQPELHLHPSAQAALADVMIDAIHARENSEARDIQLLVESHSEHFLRRFQRRIAEGALNKTDFAGYFLATGAKNTTEKLKLNEYGEIENWPEGFFGDIRGDIYKQTMAGIELRKNNK